MKNKLIYTVVIMVISICLSIYCYMVLPDRVTVQIDISGNPSNTYPKILAVLLPLMLSSAGALGHYFSKEREHKYLILSVVGIFLSILTLIFNV